MKLRCIIFCAAFFCALTAMSQNRHGSQNRHSQNRNDNRVRITGKITDKADNSDLAYVTVRLVDTRYGTTTDDKGQYTLHAPPGEYTLTASMIGYGAVEKTVTLTIGVNLTENFELGEDDFSLSEVVIQGKSPVQTVRETAYSVIALDVRDFHNTTAELKDVLAKAPGSRIRESGGVGSDMNILLDGFGGRHIQFFLDGVPLDSRNSSFNINNIPVNFAERIEVYRGVIPVEFGADALGGVVNIVTGNRRRSFVDASYSYGSFNTHKSYINVGHTTKSGFMVDINAFQNYSDNSYNVYTPVEDLEFGQIDNSKIEKVKRFNDAYRNEAIVGKFGFANKSFADRMLLGINISQNDREVQNGVRQEIVFGERRRKGSSVMPSFEYRKRDLFTEGLNASMTANYNFNKSHILDTATYKYNWAGESVYNNGRRGEQSYQNTKNDNSNWNTTANVNYKIGEMHEIVVNNVLTGFERRNNASSETETQNGIANKSRKNVLGVSYRFKYKNLWNISILGKHFNQYNSGPRNMSADETRFDYVEDSETIGAFGYGAAATYFLLRDIQFKISYENALRLPTNDELFGDEDLELGNMNIKPERSDNLNLNISYNRNFDVHGIYGEVGFIYRNTKDYIRRVTNRYVGGLYYGAYENHGNVVTKGYSAELRYPYSKWFLLGGNITYQEAINNERFINGHEGRESSTYKQRIPNIPYFYFNMDASFYLHDLFAQGNTLTLSYGNTHVREFSLYWANEGSRDSKLSVPSQFSHNVSLVYSIKGRYNFSLECQNLTDERLYDNFSLQKPGRAVYGKVRYFFGK